MTIASFKKISIKKLKKKDFFSIQTIKKRFEIRKSWCVPTGIICSQNEKKMEGNIKRKRTKKIG